MRKNFFQKIVETASKEAIEDYKALKDNISVPLLQKRAILQYAEIRIKSGK